jgi:hypothetical protein
MQGAASLLPEREVSLHLPPPSLPPKAGQEENWEALGTSELVRQMLHHVEM